MYGHLSSGKEVIATTVGDVKLTGKQAACVNCHRHSGMGSNEGSTLAPAITGEILFSEQKIKAHRYQALSRQTSSALDRQAYTKTSLRNTLSSGLDINGSPLNILMPRYIFDESNFDNLYAYLNSLSINDPGVTDTTLNIATIVDTRVDTKKIDTMVDTLKRYISDVNSKTRREDKRSEQAPIQKEWQYQGYRKFELHVWRLTGNPDTWRQQLDAYYDKTPVFAVTSGISRDSWNNVDKFCNDRKIPCILPNVKTPGFSINNFYSLYFNAGPYNDASISARYILSHPADNSQPKDILQLYDTASYSLKAKDTFNEKFVSDTNYQIKSEPIKDFINRNSINTHLKNKNTTIVIWSKELNKPLIDTLFRNKDKIKSVFIPYYLATSRESRKKLEGIDIEILASYPYIKPSSERRAIVRSNI
ncbi:MAG TPA: c-type cytochrome [Gammaproteobacteria bacterium]|nr:c-type cytochrome [Gammaproteobacteria bacterium]